MKKLISILLGLFLLTSTGSAQESKIFGYSQNAFYMRSYDITETLPAPLPSSERSVEDNSFYNQQTNLFVSTELAENFTALINLELTNNFDSDKGWGTISLQEAWVQYKNTSGLSLKFGQLLPVFNNLNEIRNRTPLFPYVTRPLVYETNIASVVNFGHFLPLRAFAQARYQKYFGDFGVDAAAFLGNSDENYLATGYQSGTTSGNPNLYSNGIDTTKFLMVGGRVGINYNSLTAGDLKLGFSSTVDRQAAQNIGLGNIPRYRFGADLSYNYGIFQFESEAILVRYQLSETDQAILDSIVEIDNLDKSFYYANLTAYWTPKLYNYVQFSAIADQENLQIDATVNTFTGGLGWKFTSNVIGKLEYSYSHYDGSTDTNIPGLGTILYNQEGTIQYMRAAVAFIF